MLSKDLSGHEGSYRLHPLSVVFGMSGAIRALILPGLAVVILARGEESDIWLMVLFGPAVVYAVVRYLTVRYELHENEIVIRQGLFFRSVRHIPYHRIQNLKLVQNVFHRVLGDVEPRIEPAGGAAAEGDHLARGLLGSLDPRRVSRRNQTLTSIAGSRRGAGFRGNRLQACLQGLALFVTENSENDPMPPDEIAHIADSIDARKPRDFDTQEFTRYEFNTSDTPPELKWLVEGFLPAEGVTTLFGTGSQGK